MGAVLDNPEGIADSPANLRRDGTGSYPVDAAIQR